MTKKVRELYKKVIKNKKAMNKVRCMIHNCYCEWVREEHNDIARDGFTGWCELTNKQLLDSWVELNVYCELPDTVEAKLEALLSECE